MERFKKLSLGIKRLIMIFYLLFVFIQLMTIYSEHQLWHSFNYTVTNTSFVEDWVKSFIFLSIVYWSMVLGVIWVVDGFNKEK